MRAKFIYEKFTEESDPIEDMGIGLMNEKATKRYVNKVFDQLKRNQKVFSVVGGLLGISDPEQNEDYIGNCYDIYCGSYISDLIFIKNKNNVNTADHFWLGSSFSNKIKPVCSGKSFPYWLLLMIDKDTQTRIEIFYPGEEKKMIDFITKNIDRRK